MLRLWVSDMTFGDFGFRSGAGKAFVGRFLEVVLMHKGGVIFILAGLLIVCWCLVGVLGVLVCAEVPKEPPGVAPPVSAVVPGGEEEILTPPAVPEKEEEKAKGEKPAKPEAAPEEKEEKKAKGEEEKGKEEKPVEEILEISVEPSGVSVYAVSVDAHRVFTELGEKAGLKIIVDDTVDRKITVSLSNKKISEVIDNIVAAYGLSSSQVNGIFIISEGIPRNPSSYLLSDIDFIQTQYVMADNAKLLLPLFLQDHVKVNPDQNAVILSAPPEVLKKFREDIHQFDIPAAQIMVELLVVELSDEVAKEFELKMRWQNPRHGVATIPSLGEVAFRAVATLPREFFGELHALVAVGKARVRANPRIATVSGRWANIFIGVQKYVSVPIETMLEGQMYYIDAGVRLGMRCWTGGGKEIIVDVSPEVSTLSAPDPVTGLPEKTTRRAYTMVRVLDGETIIIGGLRQRELHARRTKIPILGDIPVIGSLFRSTDVVDTHTELLIFITPRVLSQTGHLPGEEERDLKERFLVPEGERDK